MRIEVARVPDKFTLVKWDGTNEQEMRDLLTEASGPDGWFTFELNPDNSCTVSSPAGTFTFDVGDYMHAMLYQWGSPLIQKYTPEQADATYYLYPELPTVTGD